MVLHGFLQESHGVNNMSTIKASDINSWHTRLNAILQGHGLDKITTPTITGGATPVGVTSIVNLEDKLNEMKVDDYYQYATYSDWGSITEGLVASITTPVGIDATLSSIESTIICRNTATNNYGACTQGTCGNVTCPNGACSNGTLSNGANSLGYNSNGTNTVTCSFQSHQNGIQSLYQQSYGTCWNGVCPHSHNAEGALTNGSQTNGGHANGVCDHGSNSYLAYSNGSYSNGKNSNTTVIDVTNSKSANTN